jgi:predicted GNAT superfamily acetyltransferase
MGGSRSRHREPTPAAGIGMAAGNFVETDTKHVLVAVPKDYQAVKRAYPEAGLSWRLHTRQIFEWAFAAGYTAVDLLVEKELCYYLLIKNWVVA